MHVDDRESTGERADEDTREHVSDDQRLTDALRQEAAGERGKQHEREVRDQGHSVAAYTLLAIAATGAHRSARAVYQD